MFHERSARGDDAVALHPVGIDVEVVPSLLVHEGVEVDRQEIVHRRPIAVYAICSHDRPVLIVCVKREVDIFRVVGDVDLGLLRRGRTVEGSLLHELGDQSCRPPHFVVEAVIDHWRGVGAGGPHRRSPGNQACVFQGPIFQGPVFQSPILQGRRLILALLLSGHLPRHRDQNKPHHQGHTDPYHPGTLARSLIYEHTQHTLRIKST